MADKHDNPKKRGWTKLKPTLAQHLSFSGNRSDTQSPDLLFMNHEWHNKWIALFSVSKTIHVTVWMTECGSYQTWRPVIDCRLKCFMFEVLISWERSDLDRHLWDRYRWGMPGVIRDSRHIVSPATDLNMLVYRSHSDTIGSPANMKRWPYVALMLGHRLRRWPNIKATLGWRLVFFRGKMFNGASLFMDSNRRITMEKQRCLFSGDACTTFVTLSVLNLTENDGRRHHCGVFSQARATCPTA